MKKTIIILAAVTILAAVVSCDSDDKIVEERVSPTGNVKVNITVSDIQPTTKAIKTGWSAGDIIHVYLDDAGPTVCEPDFDLIYDGTNWTSSVISQAVIDRLQGSGGMLRGFWEGSNSCMSNPNWEKGNGYVYFPDGYTRPNESTGSVGYLVADFSGIYYTFDGSTITAEINSWSIRTNVQVVVSGLTYVSGRYTLYSPCIKNPQVMQVGDGVPPYFCNTLFYSASGRIAGVANSDGVAFVGDLNGTYDPGNEFTVYLIDNTTNVIYSYTKTLTTYLIDDVNSVKAIRIPFAKFLVNLGLSVKWAACNLGANDLTDRGDFFAWGETTPYYLDGYASETPCDHWKYGKEHGYDWRSYQWTTDEGASFTKYDGSDYTTLQLPDDAANAAYGNSYRTPTKEEFAELIDANNSNKEWVADYLGSGVSGYLFTSLKDGYETQKLFLPVSSYRNSSSIDGIHVDRGHYWSSSLDPFPNPKSQAHCLDFSSSYISVGATSRFYGQPVRPVCP